MCVVGFYTAGVGDGKSTRRGRGCSWCATSCDGWSVMQGFKNGARPPVFLACPYGTSMRFYGGWRRLERESALPEFAMPYESHYCFY